MGLTVDELADITNVTLSSYARGKITDLSTALQKFTFMSNFSDPKKKEVDSGQSIAFEVLTDESGSARHMGFYDQDVTNVPAVTTTGSFPWRGTTTNHSYDIGEPKLQNATAAKLKDIIEIRKAASDVSMLELMETTGWSKPADSTDTETPYGVPMYVVKNSTQGFNGGNPAGFTSGVGSISSSTYTRWANYTDTYTNITETDFFRNVRRATVFTKFEPSIKIATHNTGDNMEFYTNYTVIGATEEYLMSNNQNLGNDMAPKDGAAMLRRTPINWVPKLEDDSSNPFYGINWGEMKIFILEGFDMVDLVKKDPLRRHVVQVHTDVRWNLVCRNRRRNFVIYVA
jgi:hypothetical protein